MSKHAVGLIGGIGSGKSTVANLFAELGISLVDADVIAREQVAIGTPALNKIIAQFGEAILHPDGSLNRRSLRDTIFKNLSQRAWLENLLHPLIRQSIFDQTQAAPGLYCLVVIPLLKTRHDYPILNRVLMVDAPESAQIRRVMQRDNIDEVQAKSIIQAQMPRQERIKLADDLIINDGHIATLQHEVDRLHQKYLILFSQ